MSPRPYTGNKDGNHPTPRAGTKRFVEYCEYLFGVKNIGIYANRPMRSGSSLSVHATWRATDLKGTKPQRKALVEFLYEHRDDLNIEEIHAYDGTGCPLTGLTKWGAGYRCDRDAWKAWTATRNGGTPGADWTHVEISPLMADNPKLVEEAFARIFAQ
jgi:hypothetical protein